MAALRQRMRSLIAEFVPIGLALAISVVSLIAALVYSRRLRLPRLERPGVATLVMALTGESSGLGCLLRSLERQTLKPRRLLLGIESGDDPAFREAGRLIRAGIGFPIETVIAGPAIDTAQKCRNLIAACRCIDDSDEVIVFLDGDIRPPRHWLSALVSPLMADHCDIVTGYRWPTIERHSLGAYMIAAIDRTIAILPQPRWFRAVWGGSLAMSRRAYEILDLEHTLGNTLSDDLTIGTVAAERGLRVLARSSLRVASPISAEFGSAWRFGRRQYQMVRLHRPALWVLALLTMSAQLAGWCAIAIHLQWSWFARAALAMLLLFAVCKQRLLDDTGKSLGYRDAPSARLHPWISALAKPFIDTAHLSMIVAAARTRTITWAHVTYRLISASRITVQDRKKWRESSA